MRTNRFEDAALDSAPKLVIAQPGDMSLLSLEGTQRTCRHRRDATVVHGHDTS